MTTPNLDLQTIPTGTLEPSIPFNDSMQAIDALLQLAVESILAAPPVTVDADAGKRWIVDTGATGAWAGRDGAIALCTAAGLWRFFVPSEGWRADVRDANAEYRFDGASWDLASSGGGSAGLPWFDVSDYDTPGSTDKAPAINAAIAAAALAGGGVVFIPDDEWELTSAPGGASNSQIVLPSIPLTSKQITIELRGACTPPPIFSVIGDLPMPTSGTRLKSTATGSGGKVIGAATPGGAYPFSMLLLKIKDITIELPPNPGHTAVDASNIAAFEEDGLIIHTGSYNVGGLVEPTTSSSYGLKTPANGNGAYTKLGTLNIFGFYTGLTVGEHTTGEMVAMWGCKRAVEFFDANHASHFDRLMAVHCPRGLVFSGSHRFTIDQYDVEHANSGWWANVWDVDDSNNYGSGTLAWHSVLAGYGPQNLFAVNGGAGIDVQRIGVPAPAVVSAASAASIAPTGKTDLLKVTAQGTGLTIANPTSTPPDGWGLVIRLKDDGTSRTIAYGTAYRAVGVTLPAATVAGKVTYIGCIWNSSDNAFDVVSVGTQA